jgi:uncharacterized protein (UPF0276 family)
MSRDVVGVQRVLADLLADVQQRRAWRQDPSGYAASRLSGSDEAAVVAGLDPDALETAALALDVRRVLKPPSPPEHTSATRRASATDASRRPDQSPPPAAVEIPSPRIGLGYWPEALTHLEGQADLVEVWEHKIDDYLEDDPASRRLSALAGDSAVVWHSVDLSVGSLEAIADRERLVRMRRLLATVGAQELSDHLCFTRVADRAFSHFVPLWRVEEALDLTAANVDRLQETLGVRLAVENIAPIFDPGGELTVAEFLNELVRRTGCGVLLDVTNLTVSEGNGFCSTAAELETLNLDAVTGLHLAGGIEVDGRFYDAHSFPVPNSDLEWLRRLLPRLRHCRTVIVERDGRRDALSEVTDDLRRLRATLTAALPPDRGGTARGRRA